MNRENINAKYGLAFDPAVSLIIFDTKVQLSSANNWTVFGNIEFFFDPKLKISKIDTVLKIINKLAFVNDMLNAPTLISGPIL